MRTFSVFGEIGFVAGVLCGLCAVITPLLSRLNREALRRLAWASFALAVACAGAVITAEGIPERPVSMPIAQPYSRLVDTRLAFELGLRTRVSAATEGPCRGGCYGGILRDVSSIEDARGIAPDLSGYDRDTSAILWCYEWKPQQVVFWQPWFGAANTLVKGIPGEPGRVYFVLIPRRVAAGTSDLDFEPV